MINIQNQRPQFSQTAVIHLLRQHYALTGTFEPLPSERDQNFRVTAADNRKYIFKITGAGETRELLDLQNQAMQHIQRQSPSLCPQVLPNQQGDLITTVDTQGRPTYYLRLLTYLPGTLLAHSAPHPQELLRDFGRALGHLDTALSDFSHPAAKRTFKWDLRSASFLNDYTNFVADPAQRALVEDTLADFKSQILPILANLRRGIIHNDANDYNVLLQNGSFAFIDFGDMLETALIAELAIASAYALLDKPDPLAAAALVARGYHEILPLEEAELALLFPLIRLRLCSSVIMSAFQRQHEPENKYLSISETAVWRALTKLEKIDPHFAHTTFRYACELPPFPPQTLIVNGIAAPTLTAPLTGERVERSPAALQHLRAQHVGPNLSLSYEEPLKIVRGQGAYLYDQKGRAYLDAVNNVPHVGHCHPRVVRAAQLQNALLNTNTRYLHDLLVTYAERLTATLPAPLSVCYFVCSGSEANELALRLARKHTGAHDLLVLDGAYHGNTGELVNISPYKFKGKGGHQAPEYVHVLEMPDPYRGRFKGNSVETGQAYAADVAIKLENLGKKGKKPAVFIVEPLLGCGGQIVLPDGYLAAAFAQVRAVDGLCIADEVQIGFGRVGTDFWGFETQGVVPDIVTMGKPMGNGHPLAAVVTTPEIAASFANGMEYFNTFGGNPVSCAIGLAVLDVIEEENLQQNAMQVGQALRNGLQELATQYPIIGDVRGLGLYVGVELVRDQQTLEPAAIEAAAIANEMKNRGILISTDGPLHNVLKIKPPLVFTHAQAELLVETLGAILSEWDC